MIRFKLKGSEGEVVVSLDSEQPNKVAPIVYQGAPRDVMAVKRWLYYETGVYGQAIADWAAPIDLEAVMQKPAASRFSPALLEKMMGGPRKAAGGDSEG